MIKLTLTLAIVSVLTLGYAQTNTDYPYNAAHIVLKDGKELNGLVQMMPAFGEEVNFKENESAKNETIKTAAIKTITSEFTEFESVTFDGADRLMSKAVFGPATLYLHVTWGKTRSAGTFGTFSGTHTDAIPFYLLQFQNKLTKLDKENFKPTLSELFAGCDLVTGLIQKKSTKFDALIKIVRTYNENCAD